MSQEKVVNSSESIIGLAGESAETVDFSATSFATRAIHAGQEPAPKNRAIMTPIYQTSTFVQSSPGVYAGYDYARTANPTRTALQDNLASLENGRFGICYASGCAATDSVMHLLSAGDHVVCGDDLYGGSFRIFDKVFGRMGLEFSFVDLRDLEALRGSIRSNTKLVWLETPTNPLLRLVDICELSKIAHEHDLIVAVDNTFASPYLQNPLSLGADLVVHSSTKYIGGHSDVIGGAVITNSDDLARQLYFLQNAVGAVPAPFDCFLLLRSTKTLAIRMERHCENARIISEYLSSRKDILKMYYPGHPSHPQYELAVRQMKLGGGMMSLVLDGGLERSRRFLERLRVFSLAESLGGVESLAEHPAIMTHASITQSRREELGISDGLVRLSVGIEDVNDLIRDLKQALE